MSNSAGNGPVGVRRQRVYARLRRATGARLRAVRTAHRAPRRWWARRTRPSVCNGLCVLACAFAHPTGAAFFLHNVKQPRAVARMSEAISGPRWGGPACRFAHAGYEVVSLIFIFFTPFFLLLYLPPAEMRGDGAPEAPRWLRATRHAVP